MALDNAIFKPIANGYRALPIPVRKGSSNFVENLRSLLTFSNNILQGDLKVQRILLVDLPLIQQLEF